MSPSPYFLSGATAPASPTRQQRLLAALDRPACYPHPVDTVVRIDTHISVLLLAGDYAYKIKKAVTPEFVDYRTLARRRQFCEAEIGLNRRFAPDLYLRCVAIGGTPDAPVFDHEPAIEYAVKMRRFPAQARGDARARAGDLDGRAIDGLAATIADYHQHAPAALPSRDYGDPCAVSAVITGNLDELAQSVEDHELPALARLWAWLDRRLASAQPLLAERRDQGFVRDCHGDMHLANLLYRDGHWEAFDGIEFAARLRWIDVADDLAFTAMDLHAHGLSGLGHRLLNRYLEITGDYAALAVMRIYLVHRALVRSKVGRLAGPSRPGGPEDRPDYFDAAQQWSPESPVLVITHGVSGAGKSRAAAYAAARFGYIRIRSDIERKRLGGIAPDIHAADHPDHGLYTAAATATTYARLLTLAEAALRGGWPVILDATFLAREWRDGARQLATRLGCQFRILALQVAPQTARERIRTRGAADVSDADESILAHQLAHYPPLAEAESNHVCTSSGADAELQAFFSELRATARAG